MSESNITEVRIAVVIFVYLQMNVLGWLVRGNGKYSAVFQFCG